ncbi:raffinose synthase Sip1 [Podospora fimiseda]|uniref:Raffinose synthase Sip1 n=1 Tax=Podospora fimiseda TaxID=252190 RepID=A0AAN7H4V5_9PEZI|nr:raffinose synthase Sip1 [Podospora fimiseda]
MSTELLPNKFDDILQVLHIPKQKPLPPSVKPEMTAAITTYPPLGQVTQVKQSNTHLHAILQVSKDLENEQWQLAVWHSDSSGEEWSETAFTPSKSGNHPSALNQADEATARLFFDAELAIASLVKFTIKFRPTPNGDWRWIRDEQGLEDGIIVLASKPTQDSDEEDLPDLMQDFNTDLKWKSHMSQTPRTRLWSIQVGVDGTETDKSTIADVPLGIPWGGSLRWFALVRQWAPWLAPRHGKESFKIDEDAVLCSFLSPSGKHLVFLGVSGLQDVLTLFRSNNSGRLMVHIRSDNPKPISGTVLVAVGEDFESTNAAVMYHARSMVVASRINSGEDKAEEQALGEVKPQWYEDWYDGLGYCTWNALGQRLTEEKVLSAVDTLAENNITISCLIIDDNWQDIDYQGESQFQYGWNDFEAEPKTFPNGLKSMIRNIRSKHKNIQHIAVWHALLGYWGGISSSGSLAKRYKTVEVTREEVERRHLPLGGKITVIDATDVKRFYDDFYRFLSDSGIDGVKTDAQFMIDLLELATARRELINAYLDAWIIASLRHFSSKVISCMSQTPQILFYAQLPRNKPAVVVRNSDDFFPEVPESHPWHVWANAHNALFTQHLNILPDWDMFQTVHEYSGFHAAARCVSGGPIYITDVPGKHDIELIKQMTGITPRGKTVIFRPSVLGRAIDQYVTYHDLALLKIGAYHGRAATGTGIVGVFNVSTRRLTDVIPLERFPGVMDNGEYIVRSHVTGKITSPLKTNETASLITLSLGKGEYDVLAAYPLARFVSKTRGDILVASLGLVGKMTGCAAVMNTKYVVLENGRMLVDTTLKALGVLGVYISILPELSIMDDFMVTIQGNPLPPHTVSVNEKDEHVFDVDIETAWNELGLESGWANEVEVKLYFTMEKKRSSLIGGCLSQ